MQGKTGFPPTELEAKNPLKTCFWFKDGEKKHIFSYKKKNLSDQKKLYSVELSIGVRSGQKNTHFWKIIDRDRRSYTAPENAF